MGKWNAMNQKDLESLIDEALDNIRDDRRVAREFLNEIASPVAAKHIETMQRSNEQLVKLIGIKHKGKTQEVELSEADKDNLFDLIQGDIQNG